MKNKHVCKYCGKEFNTGRECGSHTTCCGLNPNRITHKKKKVEKSFKCEVCGNEYTIKISKRAMLLNDYRKTCSCKCAHKLSVMNTDNIQKGNKISKTLKEKFIDKKIKICKQCGKEFNSLERGKSSFCSDRCAEIHKSKELSISSINNKCGGYKEGVNYKKYKQGWYKGIFCNSSFELIFVLYCLSHNIKVSRCNKVLKYTYKNKEFNYYPDFEINNKIYEIKGYMNEKAKAKHEQYPEIIIIDKNTIKEYKKYVIKTYGKNYINLLEKHADIAQLVE